jgi:hypothetical protein
LLTAVLAPSVGAVAVAPAAVTSEPARLVLAVAVSAPLLPCPMAIATTSPPLLPWLVAVADAAPSPEPPVPPVAVADETIVVVPMASLLAVALPPLAPAPPTPPMASVLAET